MTVKGLATYLRCAPAVLLVHVVWKGKAVNNRRVNLILFYSLISVFHAGIASGADDKISLHVRSGAASAGANASATIISTEIQTCDELRLRTRSSYYTQGSIGSSDRRPIDTRCIRAEEQSAAQLVVQYRDSNGSMVTVILEDGSVSVAPSARGGRVAQGAAGGVQTIDVLLNYD